MNFYPVEFPQGRHEAAFNWGNKHRQRRSLNQHSKPLALISLLYESGKAAFYKFFPEKFNIINPIGPTNTMDSIQITNSTVSTVNHPNKSIPSAKRSLRVAMLSYSFYESDNRVRRYAETLTREGHSVDIISLKRKGQSGYNKLNNVKVYRIQQRAEK